MSTTSRLSFLALAYAASASAEQFSAPTGPGEAVYRADTVVLAVPTGASLTETRHHELYPGFAESPVLTSTVTLYEVEVLDVVDGALTQGALWVIAKQPLIPGDSLVLPLSIDAAALELSDSALQRAEAVLIGGVVLDAKTAAAESAVREFVALVREPEPVPQSWLIERQLGLAP